MIEIKSFSSEYSPVVGPFIVGIQHEFGVPITLADQPDLLEIEQRYMHSRGHFWVACHDGELIGTIALIPASNDTAIMRKMFVAPAFRGAPHRVGQQLFDTLMTWALDHGFRQLYLGTGERLAAACRFYEKNGFSLFPQHDLPPEVDAIKMPVDDKYYMREIAA